MEASMPYWAAARAQPQREALARHFLELKGFRLSDAPARASHQERAQGRNPPGPFPGLPFRRDRQRLVGCAVVPGDAFGLVMNCGAPVRVPEAVIAEIRSRERGGLIELPRSSIKPGDRLRVTAGPFAGHVGLYAGMKPRERVEVLLALLGGAQRVTLAADAVEAV